VAQIGFRIFLENEKNEVKPWSECSAEEKQRFQTNASKRLSATMSEYYTQHPNEYVNF
jgi:hypothetical protein